MPLASHLQSLGHQVCTPTLAGHDGIMPPGDVTLADYIDSLSAQLPAEAQLLVAHSMGGIIATAFAAQFPERVQGIIYLAAYIPLSGDSLLDLAKQGQGTQFGELLQWDSQAKTIAIDHLAAAHFLYADLPEAEIVRLSEQLVIQPMLPFVSPVKLPQSITQIPRLAIIAQNDRVITPADQIRMSDNAQVPYQILNSDHSPMLSHSSELATLIAQMSASR